MALAHFQRLGDQEGLGIHLRLVLALEVRKQRRIPADEACFEQRGLNRHIGRAFGQAFWGGAHAGADFQPRIPAATDEALNAPAQCAVCVQLRAFWQQQQHVHVRERKKLRPAISAHRHQRTARRHFCALPQCVQQTIRQGRQLAQHFVNAPGGGHRGCHAPHDGGFFLAIGGTQGLDFGHGAGLGRKRDKNRSWTVRQWCANPARGFSLRTP